MTLLLGRPARRGPGNKASRGKAAMGSFRAAVLPLLVSLPCLAQSPAASLSAYQAAARVAHVTGGSAKSFSGAAFHPGTRTLYVIDNDNASVYELDTAGALRRTLATSGLTDPEGIAYQSDDYFLITEEGLANIVRLKLPRSGTGPIARSTGTVFNLGPNMANSGIEGVAYRVRDKTAFAAKETDPPRLYRIALDSAGAPAASFPDQPFDIQAKAGDAADLAALEDGNFILVDQEQDRLEGYDAQGRLLSTLVLGMAKPEGLAFDASTGTIYMVGEPDEFAVFRLKPGDALAAPGSGDRGSAAPSLSRDARGAARAGGRNALGRRPCAEGRGPAASPAYFRPETR